MLVIPRGYIFCHSTKTIKYSRLNHWDPAGSHCRMVSGNKTPWHTTPRLKSWSMQQESAKAPLNRTQTDVCISAPIPKCVPNIVWIWEKNLPATRFSKITSVFLHTSRCRTTRHTRLATICAKWKTMLYDAKIIKARRLCHLGVSQVLRGVVIIVFMGLIAS